MRSTTLFAAAGVLAVAGLGWAVVQWNPASMQPQGTPSASSARPQGDIYRSGLPAVGSLNPLTTVDAVALRYVLVYTHETLVDIDPTSGELRACAAESWHSEDGGNTWIFVVRDGLRFSDGSTVTRTDLEFTVRACRDSRLQETSDMAMLVADLAVAEVRGDREIAFGRTERGDVIPLAVGTMFRILKADYFERAALARAPGAALWDDAFVKALGELREPGPGTGPYTIARRDDGSLDWIEGSHLTLARNEFGWQHTAHPNSWNLAGHQIRFIPDESARFAALRREEIDWFTSASGEEFVKLIESHPELKTKFRALTYDAAHLGHFHVLWNCRRAPLDRARVRRAFAALFDRDTIARDLFGGAAVPAYGWFKPGMPEYPAASVAPEFSIEGARELLAAEGFGPGGEALRVEILCGAEAPILRRIVELAIPSFRAAGVELVAHTQEFASAYARMMEGDFDGIVLIQYHDTVIDPYDFFAAGKNFMGWSDDQAEKLLLTARAEADGTRRAELYREFGARLATESPIALLVHPAVQVLLHRRFRDAEPGPRGLFPELWWVAPEDRIGGGPR